MERNVHAYPSRAPNDLTATGRPSSSSDILHATGVLSKLLSAPVQIKAGFQVEVGSNDLQGFWIYKKTVDEQEA